MNIAKVLVANRGEIAVRIIRACHHLGLGSVAVYSDADRGAPHVGMADEAFHIGPSEARMSYLDGARIIDAARRAGADAVHPGYGFLAENAEFARACADAGLAFVGPAPEVIARMGSKIAAKAAAVAAGLPVVPGYAGDGQDDARLAAEAARLGPPLLIKASAGGGGRGMRRVLDLAQFPTELAAARREAEAAFGDGAVLLERLIETSRHVEVQVLGDRHGRVLHLFERDCSLQRLHQKVIEEAPAPNLEDATRRAMTDGAVTLARDIGYDNAGTVEYILDTRTGEFFFLEMNTRLQVEHPVTEMVTGLDLVEWQLRVAGGEALPFTQADIRCDGWAVEARVAAEDPADGYRPRTGTVTAYREPVQGAVRVDSGLRAGSVVGPHYDSMLAKVIAHGRDRLSAVRSLRRALAQVRIQGVGTNTAFLCDLLDDDLFRRGRHHTGLLAARWPDGWTATELTDRHRAEAVVAMHLSRTGGAGSPWTALGAWRATEAAGRPGAATYHVRAGDVPAAAARIAGRGGAFAVALDGGTAVGFTDARLADARLADGSLDYELDGRRHSVFAEVRGSQVTLHTAGGALVLDVLLIEQALLAAPRAATGGAGDVTAPMPGKVAQVLVAAGQAVTAGQPVAVIEAMKLLQTLAAPRDGVVGAVRCAPGEAVEGGAVLVAIDAPET
ncbi:MAG: biotin/lipoyl-binding protein [Hyphomicrobiales bacterium]|nr:biotin/lipoyl-binding protein [Hyphomicrobiales bacterium]MCP5370271.1 biotin/lipoyl-binding protein [Hyphomicrobiales bacterium]